MTQSGYFHAQGHTLSVGDFVRIDGTWWKLLELEVEAVRADGQRRFRATDREGGIKHLGVYTTRGYKSYITQH